MLTSNYDFDSIPPSFICCSDFGESVYDVSKSSHRRTAKLDKSVRVWDEVSLFMDRLGVAYGEYETHLPPPFRRYSIRTSFRIG